MRKQLVYQDKPSNVPEFTHNVLICVGDAFTLGELTQDASPIQKILGIM